MAKDSKTSKTARVMNLLSKKPDPAAAPEEPAEPAEAAAPAPVSAPVPPIVTSMAPDMAVSAQIKNALEDALESELEDAPAAPEPAPQPEPEPEPEPIQAAPPEPEPEPVPVEPAPEPVPEPKPEPIAEEEIALEETHKFEEPLHPGYINVMQVLVEEKAPKYIQMFGLCPCTRCTEDVKAYTLNHLPSKYVVMEPNDRIPRLTVYEGRFTSDITAQLLQACKVVMEHPHHGR